jgi:hypothetical protein
VRVNFWRDADHQQCNWIDLALLRRNFEWDSTGRVFMPIFEYCGITVRWVPYKDENETKKIE